MTMLQIITSTHNCFYSQVNCTMAMLLVLILFLFIGVLMSAIARACMLRRDGAQISGFNDQLQVQHSINDIEVTREWSELADDVLHLITNKLRFMEDYVMFGAVCKSWHQIFLQKEKSSNSSLPWLVLRDEADDTMCRFYSPFNGKVFTKLLPELREMRCWGSNHGWLITAGMDDARIRLLNPLSNDYISLPAIENCLSEQKVSLPFHCSDYVHKVVVSSSPRASDVVIMALYSTLSTLVVLKPGNDLWTPITDGVADIIFFANKFFAVDIMGRCLIFNCTGEHIHTLVAAEFGGIGFWGMRIVESGRKIYMVIKCCSEVDIDGLQFLHTMDMFVFELDEADLRLERVYNLADWTLFLDLSSSFGVYASDYPELSTNCVYFIEQTRIDGVNTFRLGIYSLEDDRIEWYAMNIPVSNLCPPLWMVPSLY